MGTGEGRGGAPLGFYLKFLPPGGVGGDPPPPLGFYLKFLTPGAHRGNRVKVLKIAKQKGGGVGGGFVKFQGSSNKYTDKPQGY